MLKTRTFIAVPADGEVRGAALNAIDALRETAENVKWVEPENLHWTLQFLGDIDDVEMAQVCRRVLKIAAEHKPFVLCGAGVSSFPNPARPKTLYLSADDGSQAFCNLQSDIEASLADLGFRGERRQFVPHLTLGRVNSSVPGREMLAAQIAALPELPSAGMAVDEVIVYGSRLSREGPGYHVLATAPLGG